ncbi:baseplate J/gp47 family protein [Brachyspira alvinipulli]|uniref:baseplate J/gp47 family protein n=1 Tax=Brachyspira alvinipulli TaxID=84379 RepID=UPI000486CC3E|nr:baseplate J/gp47 family protein [Brachyspira alvinipulli]
MNESLEQLKLKILNQYYSELNPLENTPKYNLVKVIANVEAGIQYSLLGDIEFLKKQIFPDTAEKDFLRAHWADRVPPLYAEVASGSILVKGIAGVSIPSGSVFRSEQGNNYFMTKTYIIAENGSVEIEVQAENAGTSYNLKSESKLKLASNLIANVESEAVVQRDIAGGTDGETDEAYLIRVLNYIKGNSNGGNGDFADEALNSSSEVSKAFEFRNFNVFGALLVVVIGGNADTGFMKVSNIDKVQEHIEKKYPYTIFTVKTPEIITVNITIELKREEDTVGIREMITSTIKEYFNKRVKPDMEIKEALIKNLIVDDINVTEANVEIEGGDKYYNQLEYAVLGTITWN